MAAQTSLARVPTLPRSSHAFLTRSRMLSSACTSARQEQPNGRRRRYYATASFIFDVDAHSQACRATRSHIVYGRHASSNESRLTTLQLVGSITTAVITCNESWVSSTCLADPNAWVVELLVRLVVAIWVADLPLQVSLLLL